MCKDHSLDITDAFGKRCGHKNRDRLHDAGAEEERSDLAATDMEVAPKVVRDPGPEGVSVKD